MLEKKYWYQEAHELCCHWSQETGYSVPQVASVVAVLSPMCSWSQNLRWAHSLLHNNNAPCLGLQANHDKALRILAGEPIHTVLKGEKVKSFYACILRPHCSSVVIDRHMLKIVKWPKDTVTRNQYHKLANIFRYRANLVGMPVPEYQALTWLWQRGDLKQLVFGY